MTTISASYLASVFDHTQIKICVRHASNANEETVNKILEKLNLHKRLVINDAGCAINVQFELNVSPVNSAWGSFQAHRQVYGFIYVAEVTSAMEAALVQDKFNKLKEEYGPNLCHSRCLIFGIDTTIRHPHNQDIFQFSSLNAWKSLDQDIKALITSIFYELESKRLRMPDKSRLPLLVAPFESDSDSKSTESDTKNFRKKCLGRHNKHQADVSLLMGQLTEALMNYHSALETLVSVNDTGWIGSALEGLCVVSALVYFPDLIPDLPCKTTLSKKKPQKQLLDPRNLLSNPSSTPSLAELRKLCIPTVDDLVDRYKEAIIHYSRCKSLGIIEMEACIKATKVLTRAKKFLGASEFLQNAIYITLNLPENERVKRYSVLADLYEDIGFHRKASFYKRVAAMQCVAPQLKEPNWALCNRLLIKSLNGYGVDLEDDCSNMEDNKLGWPSVRLRVLHELVFSSEKIGHHTLGNRHAMYLLLQLFSHLTEIEEKDICTALGNFVSRHPSKSISHDDDMLDLPKLSLYAIPIVKRISPQPLLSEVKPIRVGQEVLDRPESVFIYTPASYRSQIKNHQKIPFKWCVNTACTVRILIHNPLNHTSLNISDISLVVDSSASGLHCQALSVCLPPKSEEEITLIVTPSSPGTLRILGYALRIFALHSDCYFKNISHIPANEIDIEVVHELPLLKCIFPKFTLSTRTSANSISVCRGERYVASYTVCNVSQCNVDDMKIAFEGDQVHNKLVMTVKGQEKELPLLPHDKITLSVEVDSSKCDQEAAIDRTLMVHYTGRDGEWWRLLSLNMNIKVMDCLVLLDSEIANDSSNEQMCTLNLMVKNKSSSVVSLSGKAVKGEEIRSVTLDPDCEKSYSVALDKIPFPSVDNVILEDYCLKELENSVTLRWEMNSEKNNDLHFGHLHLGSILPRQSFCNFLQGILICSAEFGGESSTSKYRKNTVGSLCEAVFSFKNVFTLPAKFEVDLDIFQDQENGYVERELDECIVCVGRRRQKFQLDPSASKSYECQLLLLRSGLFSIRASYLLHLTPGLVFKYSTPMRTIQYYSSALSIEVS